MEFMGGWRRRGGQLVSTNSPAEQDTKVLLPERDIIENSLKISSQNVNAGWSHHKKNAPQINNAEHTGHWLGYTKENLFLASLPCFSHEWSFWINTSNMYYSSKVKDSVYYT